MSTAVQSPQNFKSGEEGFLPTTAAKTWRSGSAGSCQESFDDSQSSFSDLGNKRGNVHYYFEVEFNFWNDW